MKESGVCKIREDGGMSSSWGGRGKELEYARTGMGGRKGHLVRRQGGMECVLG